MQRVAIVGSSGAGKTTLSLKLSHLLDLPIIHLDAEYWEPGWTQPPSEVWLERQKQLLAAERWIIDGNYGGTMETRFAAADTIIFLDFPRLLCTWRVLKRVLEYRPGARPDMAEGCAERFDLDFLKYVWTFREKHRPRIFERLKDHSDKTRYHLRTATELAVFLEEIRAISS